MVTACYSGGSPDGSTGPMNPTVNVTFDLLAKLWDEVAAVFPDDYAHLGGDEVRCCLGRCFLFFFCFAGFFRVLEEQSCYSGVDAEARVERLFFAGAVLRTAPHSDCRRHGQEIHCVARDIRQRPQVEKQNKKKDLC
jgi:hypothetical protein